MTLSAHQRVAFARQLLLPEIGPEGQQRLCQASARIDGPGSDLANEYLTRAGVQRSESITTSLDPRDARQLTQDPALASAATSLVAAFAAVEAIKVALGRERAPFPSTYQLLSPSPQPPGPSPEGTD